MKGFVISWYFPPINSSEGLVTFKLLKNSKYKYDVFTQNSNEAWTYGSREKELTSKNINTIFSKSGDFASWVKEGIEYFEQNHDKYDFIMSRSMAPESHEIALEIKKRYPNIKWIASFGDPLCDNPFNYFVPKYSEYSLKGKGFENVSIRQILSPKRFLKDKLWIYRKWSYNRKYSLEKKYTKLQKEVLESADEIILNNPYQKEHMFKNCENLKEKVLVFPHTYDQDFYKKVKKEKSNKVTMSYIGHLDDIRTPRQFLKALIRLKETIPNVQDIFEMNFYGNLSANDKLFIIDNELLDIVKFRKPVTYLESLEIMQKSDWLLHVDANLGNYINENIFFAAKIADYLGSKSNIFAITMDNGASADIMRETNSLLSSYSEDEIFNRLLEIIYNKTNKKTCNNENYDIKNNVEKYDNLVKEMLKK